jgi:hypothetical protein
MSDTKLIMENWRTYKEQILLEQRIVEGSATWGDLQKFIVGADPKTWKNRLKKAGIRAAKAGAGTMVAVGIAGAATMGAPALMATLGIGTAGPKIAAKLIGFMGDNVNTWTEDAVKDALKTIGTGIGTYIGSKAIMGAIDKYTKGTPYSRLNIHDNITNVVDKKYEEAFYTFMNSWFKEHPNGPSGNPDEVIPRFWANNMFSKWLSDKAGVNVNTTLGRGQGVDVSA